MKIQPPQSLQRRAPASFEIVDRRGKRVKSTITGYRLHASAEYDLNVWTQNGQSDGWEIQPHRPQNALFSWDFGGGKSRMGRTQPFRTSGVRRRQFWFLDSPVDEMPLTLHFTDGRQPYEMKIPICLANRWIYAPAALVALISIVPSYRYVGLTLEQAVIAALALLVVFTAVCYLLDLWRSYRRACRVIERFDGELARCQSPRTLPAADAAAIETVPASAREQAVVPSTGG